jgi:hypothetical protein
MELLKKTILHIALLIPAILNYSLLSAQNNIQWETQSEHRFSLKIDNKTVWRFNADPADAGKPYFDPLCVVGGPSLTLPKPADHPWHLAHWFSWKYINGVNYWETNDKGLAQGETFWETPERELHPDGSAQIIMHLGYRPCSETPSTVLLSEHRTIRVTAPAADGSYMLDWTQQFTAQEDLTLDRTPIPGEKNGVVWGGYAGLAVRLSNELKELKTIAANPENTRKRTNGCMDIYGSAGVEQNGVIGGQEYGIAILTHPATPRSGDWYVMENKDFIYLNPAILLRGAIKLNKGETITLRYRLHIHKGRWDTSVLNKAITDYSPN